MGGSPSRYTTCEGVWKKAVPATRSFWVTNLRRGDGARASNTPASGNPGHSRSPNQRATRKVAPSPLPRSEHCRLSGAGVHSRSGRGFQTKFQVCDAVRLRRIAMGILAWIVVGLIAGWLAGQVMRGGGYGVLVDIILGILGGILGGWVFGLLGIWPGGGMIGSIIVAFVGAVILVAITRLLKRA